MLKKEKGKREQIQLSIHVAGLISRSSRKCNQQSCVKLNRWNSICWMKVSYGPNCNRRVSWPQLQHPDYYIQCEKSSHAKPHNRLFLPLDFWLVSWALWTSKPSPDSCRFAMRLFTIKITLMDSIPGKLFTLDLLQQLEAYELFIAGQKAKPHRQHCSHWLHHSFFSPRTIRIRTSLSA